MFHFGGTFSFIAMCAERDFVGQQLLTGEPPSRNFKVTLWKRTGHWRWWFSSFFFYDFLPRAEGVNQYHCSVTHSGVTSYWCVQNYSIGYTKFSHRIWQIQEQCKATELSSIIGHNVCLNLMYCMWNLQNNFIYCKLEPYITKQYRQPQHEQPLIVDQKNDPRLSKVFIYFWINKYMKE